ncbi:MAG: hypothetical protein LBS18_06465 [Clostridiales bacterium]|jgi:hypothetical protein|nr:hypothetical protein [Clostridiales bacterium]
MQNTIHTYHDVRNRLYKEVEYRLSNYRLMKLEIAAYEDHGLYHESMTQAARSKTSERRDDTAYVALRRAEPTRRVQEMRDWVAVIDTALTEMRFYAPALATILTAYYGIGKPDEKTLLRAGAVRRRLMEQLCIGQTTLYRWKNDCVEWVKSLALYRGLVNPALEFQTGVCAARQ